MVLIDALSGPFEVVHLFFQLIGLYALVAVAALLKSVIHPWP